MTPERLAEIRGRHYKRAGANECISLHCGGWPCDAGELLAFLEESLAFAAVEQGENNRLRGGPIGEIAAQRARNHERWGDLSIENRPPDYAGWLPTLGEEFGETCRALTAEQGDPTRLRAELIDLAAVALMWIDSIDRAALASGDEGQS